MSRRSEGYCEGVLSLEVLHDASPLESEWEQLADRAGADPFQRPGWTTAWRQAFGSGRLEVLALRRAGRLAGLVPLERTAFTLRSPTNWHTPTFMPLAEDEAALEALASAMVGRATPRLSVGFVDEGTAGLAALRRVAERSGARMRLFALERSPFVEVSGTWEDFERRLPATRRSNLRRLRRRLEDRGRVEIEVHDGGRDLARLLEEGFAVEASGWKGREGTAIVSDPATRSFYEEVAEWAAARGWLRLCFLRLDGRPLAFDFAIEADGVCSLLKTGYVEDERSAAPGVVLRSAMLERAFTAGSGRYEFLGDDLGWKREWTDRVHTRMALEVFRSTVGGRLGWLGWAYARPAYRRVRSAISP